eukprot:scaffold53455_cov41-Cyclotella_meneghiniana.AAC.3
MAWEPQDFAKVSRKRKRHGSGSVTEAEVTRNFGSFVTSTKSNTASDFSLLLSIAIKYIDSGQGIGSPPLKLAF